MDPLLINYPLKRSNFKICPMSCTKHGFVMSYHLDHILSAPFTEGTKHLRQCHSLWSVNSQQVKPGPAHTAKHKVKSGVQHQ